MSVGRGHYRPNLHHAGEVNKLLREGGAPELMDRWQRLDVHHDMAYLAGYDVAGQVRYIDRDVFHALLDPAYAKHLGIGPIDTGVSHDVTVDALMAHEGDEKVILDADNDVDSYDGAHELATAGEHQVVRGKGGKPIVYERGLKAAIAWCAKKHLVKVPPDFACAPLLDDPDPNAKRVLAQLRSMGIADASKTAKSAVDYSKSTGDDQCHRCAHWRPDPVQASYGLARCSEVDGLVRTDRWCQRFKPRSDEALSPGTAESAGRRDS